MRLEGCVIDCRLWMSIDIS